MLGQLVRKKKKKIKKKVQHTVRPLLVRNNRMSTMELSPKQEVIPL